MWLNLMVMNFGDGLKERNLSKGHIQYTVYG